MFRQYTSKMWRSPHVSDRFLRWFGVSVLVIVVAAAALWYIRAPQVAAPAPAVAPRATVNPNVPISGTGSAYDGRHYGSSVPTAMPANPNVPISGTGSAYDGRHYGNSVEP